MANPFEKALNAIDEAHSKDPKTIMIDGIEVPYELHYAQTMTKYLNRRQPEASKVLQLAIRAQHLRRWEVPRNSYPMTKPGYYSWRTFLKKRQADQARQICIENGMTESDADRVAALVGKEDLKIDEETKVLEDVACLVFLEDQFDEFEKSVDEKKMIGILQKTWSKMTDQGHEMALKIPLSERGNGLVQKALA